MSDKSWDKIFSDYKILKHDFDESPFELTADMIKTACQDFTKTGEKEVRVLCKQDSRQKVPSIMRENGLFLLPVRNGKYIVVKGEGYCDIPEILKSTRFYKSKMAFSLDTSKVGDSEMQHLDFAYATSMVRTFFNDESLVLTIRGRKYTPGLSFRVNNHTINVKSVQTEVDAGYEGEDKVVLVEAKNTKTDNFLIRQLFYPFKKWSSHTPKKIYLLIFAKRGKEYMFWQYKFNNKDNYNSIQLVRSCKYHYEQ